MRKSTTKRTAQPLYVSAETAADLMTPNPASLRADMNVLGAVMFLADRQLRAAPVIDDAGRPVGILSESDLLGRVLYAIARPSTDLNMRINEQGCEVPDEVDLDHMQVGDIMTRGIVAVAPETPVGKVVKEMLARKVHQMFIVGGDGTLTGVISVVDVLRHLRRIRSKPVGPSGKSKKA